MTTLEAAANFIAHAIHRTKRKRYLNFIHTEKGQAKFLRDLDHQIEKYVTTSKIIKKLPENVKPIKQLFICK